MQRIQSSGTYQRLRPIKPMTPLQRAREGVAAAIELAKDLKAQKLKEEHAARMAAGKARKEAEEKQRQAEIEYR